MTMHEEWTDKLSDFLDGELEAAEEAAVAAHLRGCPDCSAVLNDLKRVVARAQAFDVRPPQRDLWPGVSARIDRLAPQRRISFTLPQFAAAAAVLIAVSGTLAVKLTERAAAPATVAEKPALSAPDSTQAPDRGAAADSLAVDPGSAVSNVERVSLADAQYDAAVADLEKALKNGRGRLDKATVEIVEHNLQIIDQAIAQARDALAADPANGYLSGHLVETRRRKLDLLRRAAALADTN
jgi:hypothetical protein